MNCTHTEACRMLIVFLIDQTRLGDKSRLFPSLIENSSNVAANSRRGQTEANEAVFYCIIIDFCGCFGHVITDPLCVAFESITV